MTDLPLTPPTSRPPDAAAAPPSGMWRALGKGAADTKLPRGLDAFYDGIVGHVRSLWPRRRILLRRARRVVALHQRYHTLSDARLREAAVDVQALFRRARETDEQVDHALAIIRESASRQLGLRPYPNQLAAALGLESGYMVELATGEGKTLAASLAAALAGWRGRGCHVITVNDYLAERDADLLRPLFKFLRLTVRHVDGEMRPPDRRAAYHADVTYCTNKEVTADFLRDRLMLGRDSGLAHTLLGRIADESGGGSPADRQVMRGLDTAIVDEADSVLIDEAVTPLIISGAAPNEEQVAAFEQAAGMAAELTPGRHYRVDHRFRQVELTREGRRRAAELAENLEGLWASGRRRDELVTQAITARELYKHGREYVVQEGKIVIVDEFTGRLMPDRTWRAGLHQAVEAKEGLEVQPMKDTLGRISFQRFFRLYRKLSGMTGTAAEAGPELWQIYKVPVVRVPTHRPCIRRELPDRIVGTSEGRWRAVVEAVGGFKEQGRPVLVGTRSVQASERLSELLNEAGIEHEVLNAVQHAEEAQIIAAAGQPGRVTVATNMAGRGTDIKLGGGVAEMGGLVVICTERHESRRIDRQLFGRAGRQGDPGLALSFASVEDDLVRRYGRGWRGLLLRTAAGAPGIASRRTARAALGLAQQRAERAARTQRKGVLRSDHWLDEHLGFAGPDA